jgi:hypothetical protein
MADNNGQHVWPLEMKRAPWNDPDTLVLTDGAKVVFFHGVYSSEGRPLCRCCGRLPMDNFYA